MSDEDAAIRVAAFRFLDAQRRVHPNAMPWATLSRGFDHRGRRVPLISQQGIFRPAACRLPLTIRTAPVVEGQPRPHEDEIEQDGFLAYRYRGGQADTGHRENEGLRIAMRERVPLIYLFGVAKGLYVPAWPVFIVGDEPSMLTFRVAMGADEASASGSMALADLDLETDAARRYATRTVLTRLHQQGFRARVLRAYRDRCAICRLRHQELLEAAHILPDGHPDGLPIVPNGLSLCALHHAAFDGNVLGVRPDLKIEIRLDVLQEKDGPMLEHGLQGFHGAALHAPRSTAQRPRKDFLEERYALFRKAG